MMHEHTGISIHGGGIVGAGAVEQAPMLVWEREVFSSSTSSYFGCYVLLYTPTMWC